jgi:hypothetical protein
MNHKEIRARILMVLYRKHYSGDLESRQITDQVIEEARLNFVDRNLVYGDIVYLRNGDFIEGDYTSGSPYPYALGITNAGIDEADRIITGFIDFLNKNYPDDPETKQLTILRDQSLNIMLIELMRVIKQRPELFRKYLNPL